MSIHWVCKAFSDLSTLELYAILQLRNEVFVVEQNCVFQDLDNKDQASYHFMGWKEGILAAYTRLVPAGLNHDKISIGRVVTSAQFRGAGIGRELMIESINMIYVKWGRQPIHIGAQLYLKAFYESLGFQQSSSIYLEDGIDHIEMVLP